MNINVTEFRAKIREVFAAAANDEPVFIERGGVDFLLIRRKNIANLRLHSSEQDLAVIHPFENEINRSGKPNSCNCPMMPVPHSHLEDDGKSHNIRPAIEGVVIDPNNDKREFVSTPNKTIVTPEQLQAAIDRKKKYKTLKDTALADCEANYPEDKKTVPACCSKAKRCVHWEFDNDKAQWVNSITGEIKEVV